MKHAAVLTIRAGDDEIHARLPEELEIEFEELRTALALVQSMDPPGVGARSAAECLALQIRRMPGVPGCSTLWPAKLRPWKSRATC